MSTQEELQKIKSLTRKKSAPVKTMLERVTEARASDAQPNGQRQADSPAPSGFALYGRDRRAKSHYYGELIICIHSLTGNAV